MNEKEIVSEIQKKLREMSYHDADIPSVSIDGIYGDETRSAVVVFQKKHGIEETGIVDRKTYDMLQKKYREMLDMYGYPEKISVFPLNPENFILKNGDKTFATEVLQYMLTELSVEWLPFCSIEINGVFDDNTEAAIKIFQERCGFDITGKVDRKTWNKLAILHNERQKKYSE